MRIAAIQREIDQVRRRRGQLRERRHKQSVPTAALVGYTNAGKTTLFNRLTKERAVASDALFVTLDPLVRQVHLPDRRELLLSDTVGFIVRLPHTLVAAFRATLEEVVEADLVLHVSDAASPERDRQSAAVLRVLEEGLHASLEREDDELTETEARKRVALLALRDVEYDFLAGKLDEEDYRSLKGQLTAEALAALEADEAARSAVGSGPDADVEAEIARIRAGLRSGLVCGECGFSNVEGSRFCSSCGLSLADRAVR
jgi:tRNA U34 5-carboxymethylaminomethyl modifying GTPase MnmE/TrmE